MWPIHFAVCCIESQWTLSVPPSFWGSPLRFGLLPQFKAIRGLWNSPLSPWSWTLLTLFHWFTPSLCPFVALFSCSHPTTLMYSFVHKFIKHSVIFTYNTLTICARHCSWYFLILSPGPPQQSKELNIAIPIYGWRNLRIRDINLFYVTQLGNTQVEFGV